MIRLGRWEARRLGTRGIGEGELSFREKKSAALRRTTTMREGEALVPWTWSGKRRIRLRGMIIRDNAGEKVDDDAMIGQIDHKQDLECHLNPQSSHPVSYPLTQIPVFS